MKTPTISQKTLNGLGLLIDSELVSAKRLNGPRGLYAKLNEKYPTADGWVLLRAPVWVGEYLVAFVCKPRSK